MEPFVQSSMRLNSKKKKSRSRSESAILSTYKLNEPRIATRIDKLPYYPTASLSNNSPNPIISLFKLKTFRASEFSSPITHFANILRNNFEKKFNFENFPSYAICEAIIGWFTWTTTMKIIEGEINVLFEYIKVHTELLQYEKKILFYFLFCSLLLLLFMLIYSTIMKETKW